MKAFVSYFSASGITAKVAKKLAQILDAKTYEIKPLTAYTSADLDWRDKSSRSSMEMSDESCRPKLADKSAAQDISNADVIFVGFPVWWYREPSIIDTFLETYNFKGKTIIPFVTSGSSGIGSTGVHMQQVVGKDAKVLDGKRFAANVSEEEIKKWTDSLDI